MDVPIKHTHGVPSGTHMGWAHLPIGNIKKRSDSMEKKGMPLCFFFLSSIDAHLRMQFFALLHFATAFSQASDKNDSDIGSAIRQPSKDDWKIMVRESPRDGQKMVSRGSAHHKKESIQPQVPLRLPCYDFTSVTNPTVLSDSSGRTYGRRVFYHCFVYFGQDAFP